MHPETHLVLHHNRAAELQAQADAHRLAVEARHPRDLRQRLGWTLVEVGLRLASEPRPATV
ncbi:MULTISPECIES: hypothetical protein [Streptomyces]|uniref:hypothetical protein n=1 Tax=Streptomyces TaxID=1883 RepID=UPI0013714A83|nr:hypothetical protein [Streptomyces sp. SID2888]MYV45340.1 hypothetical protein [Streptomyces sp. SID2888]